VRAACAAAGIAVVAYASLGCGQLLSEPVVQQIAAKTGKTAAQVCAKCAQLLLCFELSSRLVVAAAA